MRAVLLLMLAACSSPTASVGPGTSDAAPEAGDAAPGDVGSPDAVDDADAGATADACVNAASAANDMVSNNCLVAALSCSSCSGSGVLYACTLAGSAFARPPATGCVRMGSDGGAASTCCDPACVQTKSTSFCGTNMRDFACPVGADGNSIVGTPNGCYEANYSEPTWRLYCCPP